MNLRTSFVGLGAATLLAALAPISSAQLQGYELTSGVPADFFLVTGSKTNAERAFIDAHWARVHEAFMDSGIGDELMDMISAEAPPEAMEMVHGVYQTMSGLVEAVDWNAMGTEVVFGQRLNAPDMSGEMVGFSSPDMVILFKVNSENGPALYNNLVGLERGVLAQIQAFSGVEIKLQDVEASGTKFTVLDFKTIDPIAPDYPISIGLRENAIVMTLGSGVRGEVAALLAGEGNSIASSPRFAAAFKGMPAAEDGFEYTDMPNLRANMGEIFGVVKGVMNAQMGGERGDAEGGMADKNAMIMGMVDHAMELVNDGMSLTEYSVSVHHTEGFSVHTDTRAGLAAGAKDNRFYPMLATSRPVGNFAQYLPASTTGYSVSGGTDLDAIYNFALETIKGFGPMGEQALGMWEGMQAESGFDMRRDVISWIDGETISADFMLNGQTAWVTRMKVKDEAMAQEKMAMALGMIPMLIEKAAEQNPMAMMLGITVTPTRDARFEGFSEFNIAMAGQSILCGVKDGWMVFSSSGDALALTDEVAAGNAPNVLTNEAVMADAMTVDGAVSMANFTDYSGMASGIADGIMGVTMMGGMVTAMIEDPQGQKVAQTALRMLGDLAPVIREIDFFRSGSSVANFDGTAWNIHAVTNYEGPKKAAR